MSMRYKQSADYSGATRFVETPVAEVEFSKMTTTPTTLLDFNAGDIVPIRCFEVLPHSTYDINLDFVIRQTNPSIVPIMGSLIYDVYAFYVPNRIVNRSWRNVLGENTSGFWSAPSIELAPLVALEDDSIPSSGIQIPVGSIADYYGFPTQGKIPKNILAQTQDLWARGFLSIVNNYFRDENFQPPYAFSELNIYEGFFCSKMSFITAGGGLSSNVGTSPSTDGSFYEGAIADALAGHGGKIVSYSDAGTRLTNWSALDKPIKANKLHDAFTSALPAPQKGAQVMFSVQGEAPVSFTMTNQKYNFNTNGLAGSDGLRFVTTGVTISGDDQSYNLGLHFDGATAGNNMLNNFGKAELTNGGVTTNANSKITGWNLLGKANLNVADVGISVNDLRTAVATQQVLELLARGGSRYWEFLKSFFGIEIENPFPDIPTQIGHIRRELDMYQVAQTSPATSESDRPQGSLSAFGYTNNGGHLFTKTFLEHGYVHIFGIVRHKPLYSSFMHPMFFRRGTMDFYMPQFANISEQPIRLVTLNPFMADSMETAIGFQEAWYEYRHDFDTVCGRMRSQPEGVVSLNKWHLGDEFDPDFTHVNGDWLYDQTQEILDRSLYVTSDAESQFIGQFSWKITKQLPMPVYSVPGLDTI